MEVVIVSSILCQVAEAKLYGFFILIVTSLCISAAQAGAVCTW